MGLVYALGSVGVDANRFSVCYDQTPEELLMEIGKACATKEDLVILLAVFPLGYGLQNQVANNSILGGLHRTPSFREI